MKKFNFKALLISSLLFLFAITMNAQEPGSPPPPPPEPSSGGNLPVGGGSPIGEGLLLLLIAGNIYGIMKWKQSRTKDE
ncbi:MAG TPA: hypothetical protein PK904_19380 [Bacteroidales bacterium]|nr:hypothetical protein [Bacteroidales bacterium]